MTINEIETMNDNEFRRLSNDELRELINKGRKVANSRIKRLQESEYWDNELVKQYNTSFLRETKNATPSNIKELNHNDLSRIANYVRVNIQSSLASISGVKEYEYNKLKSIIRSLDEDSGNITEVKQTRNGFSIDGKRYSRNDISNFFSEVRRAWESQNVLRENMKSKYESEKNFNEIARMFFVNNEYQGQGSLANIFINNVYNRAQEINRQLAIQEAEREENFERVRNNSWRGTNL